MFASSSAAEQKSILVLGDSLSAAYNMAPEQGWVYLLQQRVQRENLPIKVINASVSGATTAAGLQILPAALSKHTPQIVVLELGANDGLQGKPLNYIRANLQRLIQLCKNAGAEVLLLGVRIPPNYGDAYALPFFNQYAELADQYELAYLPFFLEGVAGQPDLMMADGLHPRAEAQALILENVWPSLAPLLGKAK